MTQRAQKYKESFILFLKMPFIVLLTTFNNKNYYKNNYKSHSNCY
jgi:hypothetical protein